jgi:hypothetical protein
MKYRLHGMGRILWALGYLAVAGCVTTTEAGPEPEKPEPEPAVKIPADQSRQILDAVLGRASVAEQARAAESMRWTDRAIEYRDRAEIRLAREAARKALEVWPRNRWARLLLEQLDELVGHRKPSIERIINRSRAEQRGLIIETMHRIRKGERHVAERMYERARHEFKEAEALAMAMPDTMSEKEAFLPVIREALRKLKDVLR